jgi:hypothetical protein
MNDEHSNPNAEDSGAASPGTGEGDAWKEVGEQFQKVGESLAAAFRAAWDDPQTQQHFSEMKTGVEAMLHEVGQAMRDTAATPEAQQARAEAKKAFQRARAAGEHTVAEARPHLLTALRELDTALQKWLAHLEQAEPAGEAGEQAGPGGDAG